jgi:MFS family permease
LTVSKPNLSQQGLKAGLMASLNAQRAQRLPATISSGLMAASGVLLGFGLSLMLISFVDSGDEPNSLLGFVTGLICMFLAWVVAAWFPEAFRPAGVAALNILVPVTALVTLIGQLEKGNVGLPLLFAALLTGIFWVLPGTAGRPALQTFATAYLVFAFVAFSVQGRIEYYIYQLSQFNLPDPIDFLQSLVEDSGSLLLILGALLVAAGHQLDRKAWMTLATPFFAIGIFSIIGGSWALLLSDGFDDADSSRSGPLALIALVAVGLAYVGGYAGRRLVLGLGVHIITVGLVVLTVFMAGDDPSASTLVILMLVVAAAVSFASWKLQPKIVKATTPKP